MKNSATAPTQELNGHGAKNIAVIVMNPKTGEIYAMATNHGYDLSDPYNVSSWYDQDEVDALSEEEQAVVYNDMWSNFCVSYAFELGLPQTDYRIRGP